MELGAIVIPNITYPTVDSLWFYLNGLETCKVVAFSTMGYVDDEVERKFLIEAVKQTVDKLSLNTIIVFDICGDNNAVNRIFAYAIRNGIKIVVPDNIMKLRNSARKRGALNAWIK